MGTIMPTEDARDLLTLTQWMSPAFPLGGFAYSHGLENAILTGAVLTAQDLGHWLRGILAEGSGRSDGVLLSMTLGGADVRATDALARALAASPERLQESLDQGRAFLRVSNVLHGGDWDDLTLPVAIGVQARGLSLAPQTVLALYLQSFASNLVQGAVRLIPLGQTQGQQVMQDLAPLITELAHGLNGAGESGLASASIGADLASMAHETQEIRLFRS